MADFVIKPGAGVSNKLILQTQDATDVLTTSASGVTINSPTLVTPALGTVATGNLSNTAIVYPAGHVVQVVEAEHDAQNTTGTTTFNYKSGLGCTITPLLNNSSMLVSAYSNSYNPTTSATHNFDLYRNSLTLTETYNLSGDDRGMILLAGTPTWYHWSLCWLDNTMNSRGDKNAIEYAVTMKVSAGTGYINNNARSMMVIMEIAV